MEMYLDIDKAHGGWEAAFHNASKFITLAIIFDSKNLPSSIPEIYEMAGKGYVYKKKRDLRKAQEYFELAYSYYKSGSDDQIRILQYIILTNFMKNKDHIDGYIRKLSDRSIEVQGISNIYKSIKEPIFDKNEKQSEENLIYFKDEFIKDLIKEIHEKEVKI
uniref:Uncharacterized protein n=1 Tax=Acrobeloides nanus TaxID=290746 RepID=A0A914EC71_9BILA